MEVDTFRAARYNFCAVEKKDVVLAVHAAACVNAQTFLATPDQSADSLNGALTPSRIRWIGDGAADGEQSGNLVAVIVGKPTVSHLSAERRAALGAPPSETDVVDCAGRTFSGGADSTVEMVRTFLRIVADREKRINETRLMQDFETRFPAPARVAPAAMPSIPVRGRYEWIGAPIFSAEEVVAAGEHFGAGQAFFDLVPAFYAEFDRRVRLFGTAPAPDVLLAVQGSHECGWFKTDPTLGRYCADVSCVDVGATRPYATAGIKTEDASGDEPKDFEVPEDPATAANLHFNHIAPYLGLKAIDPVHGRLGAAAASAAEFFERNGRFARFFGDFGDALSTRNRGVWAADKDYASKLKQRQSEIAHYLVNR